MLKTVRNILRFLLWVVGIVVLAGIVVVTLEIASSPDSPGPLYLALINLNLLVGLLFALFILRRLVVAQLYRRGPWRRARLPLRLIASFATLAIVPAISIAAFAIVMLNQGIETWFSDRVVRALEGSRQVAQAYLEEQTGRLQLETELVGQSLPLNTMTWGMAPENLNSWLDEQQKRRALASIALYGYDGSLLGYAGLLPPQLAPEQLIRPPVVQQGEIRSWVVTDAQTGQMVATAYLPDDSVLVTARWLPQHVVERIDETTDAFQEYFELRSDRHRIRLIFTLFLVLLAIGTLAAAVWAGMRYASRLVPPIIDLLNGTHRVSMGDMDIRLVPQDDDELGNLTQSFNRMTRQLKQGRELLEKKNQELDDRRRMLEAILTGVRAGVLTLDDKGDVRMVNQAGRQLLNVKVGTPISTVISELNDERLGELFSQSGQIWQQQVKTTVNEEPITLLVRLVPLTRKRSGPHAAVLTCENISELLSAQRVAAWADVARRLAHEIKNPLTPIQLSAERIRRKFANELPEENREQFSQLVKTIGNQVESMRALLNEFTDFARMPSPIFNDQNVVDIIEEQLVLQRVARPEVDFKAQYKRREMNLRCDREQLTRLFANLLENAVNAIAEDPEREEKGKGEIKVVVKMSQDDRLSVSISDNGKGLPKDVDADKLFDPYVTTRQQGTGLGLAIVRRIMEEHQGQVRMIRHRTGGTTVELKFAAPEQVKGANK